MGSIDYHRHTLRLEALPPAQRRQEIERFSQRIRVFHYATDSEHLAPHGGGLSVKMVVRGVESFFVGGQCLRLRTGEALLMPPGIEYGSEITQPTESFSAFFPKSLCLQLGAAARCQSGDALEASSWAFLPQIAPIPIHADAALLASMRAAREHLEHQAPERAEELLQEAALRLMLTARELQAAEERLSLTRAGQRRELLRRLQRAKAYLHDNIARQVDLDSLAEVSHVSRFHLLRSFRQAFGLTPAQYQAELRLERAAVLLGQRQLPVVEVAHAVGFLSHSAFSRAWKRRYGYPPCTSRP
jgi:AraC family transcriptional regulator